MERWTTKKYKDLIREMQSYQDEDYRRFNERIINTKLPMMGIRTPILRSIASKVAQTDITSFLAYAKDATYEEVLLQGFVIAKITDVNLSFSYFQDFVYKIDNWAICDLVVGSMKIVRREQTFYWPKILSFLEDDAPFVVRVGLILLLDYYMEDDYLPKIFALCDRLQRKEYYIEMAVAWLVSVCYIHDRDLTLDYLKNNRLDRFTYNKTIQKIIESNRVSPEEKQILRQMKRS